MSHFIAPILEWLGVDAKTLFLWYVIAFIAVFIFYALRTRSHGRVFAVLFVLMGLSFFTFLFIESAAVRWSSAAMFAIASVASLVWAFVRQRKEASRK